MKWNALSSEYGSFAESYEHRNETSGTIKDGEILDQ